MAEINDLLRALMTLGAKVDEETASRFSGYMEGVLDRNERVNLTAIKERGDFIEKHYIDSISPVCLPEWKIAKHIIDVGTGGGFPGVPLAIVSPEKEFVLVDSLAKRLKIVDELCRENGVANCAVLHGRAEDIGRDKKYREAFDVCVSRAVGHLSILAEYCLPLVRSGGVFIAYKSGDVSRETSEAEKAISTLGGELSYVRDCSEIFLGATYDTDHCLIVIKKVKKTPARFPRKAGAPAREPIR